MKLIILSIITPKTLTNKKKHLNHLCIPYPYVIWCSVFSWLNSSQWTHSWKTSLTSCLPNNYTGCCRKALQIHCHASGECLRCCHLWLLPVIWDTKILLNIEKKRKNHSPLHCNSKWNCPSTGIRSSEMLGSQHCIFSFMFNIYIKLPSFLHLYCLEQVGCVFASLISSKEIS